MMKKRKYQSIVRSFITAIACLLISGLALANPAEILKVLATKSADNNWSFSVTLNHDDTGWDHYANAWDVSNQSGKVIYGKRILHHPHVNEMPFTRSLSNVTLPTEATRVWIRAYDNLSDTPSGPFEFELPTSRNARDAD